MIVDQTHWGHISVTGEDRIRFMQGMCTANIATLDPASPTGAQTRAAILSAKGRVTSIVEILARPDDLLLHCEPDLATRVIEILSRYAIVDDVEFTAIELAVHRVWDSPQAVWDAPLVLAPPPGPAADPEAVEIRRVEAGLPRYGVDVTEDHFPFESGLGRYIDYEKGCYLGQEPISRVHFRGNPNKALRGLLLAGDGAVAPGTAVSHPDKPDAGIVTSSVVSPDFGPIALAYLHRKANEVGGAVTVDGREARVADLPLTR